MPININNPISNALNSLQNVSMQIWRDNQWYKESEKNRKLRFDSDVINQATQGLSAESNPEDFKLALDTLNSFESDKYLGTSAKLISEKVESMQGIARERTKSIDEFQVMFDESRKAGAEWATDDMGQMLNDLKDVRLGDLDYLSAQDKQNVDNQMRNIKAELTTKTQLTNLFPQSAVEQLQAGKKVTGMESGMANSVTEAFNAIEAGNFSGALQELNQFDEQKNVADAKLKLQGQATEMVDFLKGLEGFDAEDAEIQLIEQQYKSGLFGEAIVGVGQYVGSGSMQEKQAKKVLKEYNAQVATQIDTKKQGIIKGDKDDEKVNWVTSEAYELSKQFDESLSKTNWTDGTYIDVLNNSKALMKNMLKDIDIEVKGIENVESDGKNLQDAVNYLSGLRDKYGNRSTELAYLKENSPEYELARIDLIEQRVDALDMNRGFPTFKSREGARHNLKKILEIYGFTSNALIISGQYGSGKNFNKAIDESLNTN